MKLRAISTHKRSQLLWLLVDVTDSLINSILSHVFRWELIVSTNSSSQWNCVMHEINIFLCPASEVSNETIHIMSLWHGNWAVSIVLLEFIHEHEGHVFIVDVQNEIGSRLVDTLWEIWLGQQFKGIICLTGVVFVDQVEWVPFMIKLLSSLCFTIGCKSLVSECINIDINCWIKAFFLHPWTTISNEL